MSWVNIAAAGFSIGLSLLVLLIRWAWDKSAEVSAEQRRVVAGKLGGKSVTSEIVRRSRWHYCCGLRTVLVRIKPHDADWIVKRTVCVNPLCDVAPYSDSESAENVIQARDLL